ncbi:hypothetical protein ISN45_Aa06g003120 [Arabidopsis thaliana x Arabidopsis arenosa]|uniref:Uncharacterized protein n=1 Tax=Arabidopsis thaliana x Arabidopsis arenosa TaxID=1240361 RepID=A0A8T1YTG5_9BRAS|nr:hypothetical protein ISN45_Aa06g003120 [Arabidopsis thaliana x Arabidopsis arenosa]
MSNWRRQKPRNNNYHNYNHQRGTTTMTQSSSKPPLANSKLSVPAWEKDFCAVIGSVPWWRVVEAKRFMHIYDRVVQWDDSAGEDAFKNAKSRFWAEINGLTCDLSLPDPDVYIDDVDWDAEVDTELILDLERGPDPLAEEQEHVVILDALVLSGQYSGLGWGTGWGDAEGINEENFGTGKPENSWDNQKCDGWNEDSWGIKEKTECWDHNNNNFNTESWDQKKCNNNSFNHKKVENWNGRDQGRESRGWRKRGEVQHGGDRVEDCRWRNGRGRSRGGFQQHSSNAWGWTESF